MKLSHAVAAIAAGLLAGVLLAASESRGQTYSPETQPPVRRIQQPYTRDQQAYCWYAFVGAESYTLACANGYWATYTADGEVITGHGIQDPNAVAPGSVINIDPTTGGVTIRGPNVAAPAGPIPTPSPYSDSTYGMPPRER